MGAILITVLLPFLAQADQINDRNVYEVRVKENGSSYFAERTDKNENSASYVLRPITRNGVGSPITVLRKDVELIPITLKIARDKIQEQEDRYFRTVNGVRVPKDEFDLAERAKTAAVEFESSLKLPEVAISDTPAVIEKQPVNPLLVWGPQVALVLSAIVVIGIIVKLMILEE